jgi:hypothetical protein
MAGAGGCTLSLKGETLPKAPRLVPEIPAPMAGLPAFSTNAESILPLEFTNTLVMVTPFVLLLPAGNEAVALLAKLYRTVELIKLIPKIDLLKMLFSTTALLIIAPPAVNALITFPKALKDLLIFLAYYNCCPTTPVFPTF